MRKGYVCTHRKVLALTGYSIFATKRAQCLLFATHAGEEGCKTFLATQGLGHILFVQVQNDPLKQTYWFINDSCYTWVLCKPFSFYVLSTWKMLRWAAVFDKQTPQCLLHTSSLAQMVSGSKPKVGLYMAFSSWGGVSLSLCCTATAH